jgi:endonuclease/exonuclease/phosphatase family metal-dependent hydrolase
MLALQLWKNELHPRADWHCESFLEVAASFGTSEGITLRKFKMKEVQSLRIANWNVQRALPGKSKFETIAEVISTFESDIWFLTETHETLTPGEEFYSVFSSIPDRKGANGEQWTSIWSRWPVTSLENYVSNKARCVAGLIPQSPFGSLVLYGTILPWSGDRATLNGGNFLAYESELNGQQGDWVRIRKDYPEALLILAGDFNQSLVDKHYYGSKRKRFILEESLRQTQLTSLTSGENDPVFRDSRPNACIDHICVSGNSGLRLISTQRWPDSPNLLESPSDHYRISVLLALPNLEVVDQINA